MPSCLCALSSDLYLHGSPHFSRITEFILYKYGSIKSTCAQFPRPLNEVQGNKPSLHVDDRKRFFISRVHLDVSLLRAGVKHNESLPSRWPSRTQGSLKQRAIDERLIMFYQVAKPSRRHVLGNILFWGWGWSTNKDGGRLDAPESFETDLELNFYSNPFSAMCAVKRQVFI